jgi:hypothetical protein
MAVTLVAGQIYRDADFGYSAAPPSGFAVVGDTVWYDMDQNGVRDPGEAGIEGIMVQLKTLGADGRPGTGDETLVGSTLTSENGMYLFKNVAPGAYYVAVVAGLPVGVSNTVRAPNPTRSFTVSAGAQYLDADIGYMLDSPAAVGNLVWRDDNNNGQRDASEAGIPGVTVDLRDMRDTVLATIMTNQDGEYWFPGMAAGGYEVVVTDTQDVLGSYRQARLGPLPGQDNNNQRQPYTVNLAAGQTDATADFGYVVDPRCRLPGMIGNLVWHDVLRNGVYEPGSGDMGIAGVTLVLLDAEGRTVATTTTGTMGGYVFTGLAAGTYWVQVTDVHGVLTEYERTMLGASGLDNNNQVQPYAVLLPAAGFNMTADFGYRLTAEPTPTPTPMPGRGYWLYLPLIIVRGDPTGVVMCDTARLNIDSQGVSYSFSLTPDGNVKAIPPISWNQPTRFEVVYYDGFVTWTQYQPYYSRQSDGYVFVYPGGMPGHDFRLLLETECGAIAVETTIVSPTP